MILIEHRRNTVELLRATNANYGCEIDVRNHLDKIIVIHDAFDDKGPSLEEWLEHYHHRFLIINVKEEGLEPHILTLLQKRGITDFFILDESFPFIRQWALKGVPQFALRVSELEDHRTALNLAKDLQAKNKKVNWIWADSFTGQSISADIAKALRTAGYALCFVSPELHHINEPESWEERITLFATSLRTSENIPDMICTKLPGLWEKLIPLGHELS